MTPFTEDTIEYPGDLLLEGLQHDVHYTYVVSTYLDGLVNYTKHDDVVLIRTSHDDERRWLFYFDRDSSDCCIGWTHAANTSHDDLGDGTGDVKTLLPIAKLPEWVQW